jgi:hypothetical protein
MFGNYGAVVIHKLSHLYMIIISSCRQQHVQFAAESATHFNNFSSFAFCDKPFNSSSDKCQFCGK